MKYALVAMCSSRELAEMCRKGKCPVSDGAFICPLLNRWRDGVAQCDEVVASDWDDVGIANTFDGADTARRDIRFNLSRKAKVEELMAMCKGRDVINRMSLEGELLNVMEELDRLAEAWPKEFETVMDERKP